MTCAYLITLAAFVLPTGVHERYIYYCIPLAIALAVHNRLWIAPLLALLIVGTAEMLSYKWAGQIYAHTGGGARCDDAGGDHDNPDTRLFIRGADPPRQSQDPESNRAVRERDRADATGQLPSSRHTASIAGSAAAAPPRRQTSACLDKAGVVRVGLR